ncbi:trans-resveratrol di-o-methyltransferase [Phtheirospermum japonicum]|uniref:Trans-resveratrol di-o-methyltransferase n=1 Tax=Phtheirospermum japonicum TaxID=374723 RepID=A0A830DE99_9LAMI|nr:trans-resveratrol di-o-methyltransferase [Phtheirospermum japonicum]
MSLKCAVELGIPDIIHKHAKPITLSQLMDALPSINKANKSLFVERLMRILVHSKFFETDPEGGYCLTPASRLLVRDKPLNVTPLVLLTLEPNLTEPWHHLSEWFKSDDPTPFVTTHGRTFWEQAEKDPWLNQLFNESMASDTRLATSVIVRDCGHVFRGLKSVVDVGGGTGSMAKAIVDAFPALKCSVLDLPHVVAGLEEGNENLSFVGGDMFESIPPADAVFMKCILHDWPGEDCIKILKKCKEAIPKGGKVIIVDMVVDSESEHKKMALMETQLLWDMQMMTLVAGRERTEKDWAQLFYDAGFTTYNIAPVLGLRSLIQVFP